MVNCRDDHPVARRRQSRGGRAPLPLIFAGEVSGNRPCSTSPSARRALPLQFQFRCTQFDRGRPRRRGRRRGGGAESCDPEGRLSEIKVVALTDPVGSRTLGLVSRRTANLSPARGAVDMIEMRAKPASDLPDEQRQQPRSLRVSNDPRQQQRRLRLGQRDSSVSFIYRLERDTRLQPAERASSISGCLPNATGDRSGSRDVELLRLGEFRKGLDQPRRDYGDHRLVLHRVPPTAVSRCAKRNSICTEIRSAQHLFYRRTDSRRIAPASLDTEPIAPTRSKPLPYQYWLFRRLLPAAAPRMRAVRRC